MNHGSGSSIVAAATLTALLVVVGGCWALGLRRHRWRRVLLFGAGAVFQLGHFAEHLAGHGLDGRGVNATRPAGGGPRRAASVRWWVRRYAAASSPAGSVPGALGGSGCSSSSGLAAILSMTVCSMGESG